ncbi:tetratricopeptide repeat protein [Anaerostipes sp.]|uniref:tetratricopeptide repeat protein n=1 Tax=Anaerostipes sp. TaxID=1872530 RepID=UPI0025C70CAF|nr:tetratricopeptide repeat protein [Anaerostipes sp.]MBS7007746.1 tetratricopeptide repeat protein [Anaerostipes sp.]
MDKKLKAVLIAVLVVVIGGAGFLGYEYVTQKLSGNEGIEYLTKGEYQKAYEAFQKAAGKKTLVWTSQKNDVMFYQAESLYQLKRYKDAIEVYDQIIKKKPQGRAYEWKALCYAGLGQEEQAVKVCDEGIAALPSEGESYYAKYGILAKQKKYDQALAVVNKALEQKVTTRKKELMFARISLYESKFDFKTAYKYAKEYVKAYPNDEKGKKEATFLETR